MFGMCTTGETECKREQKVVIKPTRNCQNPTVIQGVFGIIALLRCLFPNRISRISASQVYSRNGRSGAVCASCENWQKDDKQAAVGPGWEQTSTNSETGVGREQQYW